ncbi:hypothetical protein PCANC_22344 [Puccinia coronata f. sp. avenae]|uniref:Uncharacterized protein n=1 Tax=Puccinia coronata f. sp. avenae TaxID=200324 RepID=A0A2N5TTG2_9BASI|nr:hypothetical protein PCASD_22660 [Puccinia coronata f. sp. avenae]PLW27558.1 hypothetical protein PCANC_22344 [Puccinia coronata f. sp. avenae]PLW28795.1 hypothetical protein PCASD_18425 [Puccinia coronata f. sp. avenae]
MLSPILVLLLSCCSLGHALPGLAPAAAGLSYRGATTSDHAHNPTEVLVTYGPGHVYKWDRAQRKLLRQDLPPPPPPMQAPPLQLAHRHATKEEEELIQDIIRERPTGFNYKVQPGKHMEIQRQPKGKWEIDGFCGRIRVYSAEDGALLHDTGCCNCESGCDCVLNAAPACRNCADSWMIVSISTCPFCTYGAIRGIWNALTKS